jgi:peroxiredoxin
VAIPTKTIAEQVETLAGRMAKQVPADALRAFSDEQAGLDAAQLSTGVATPGTPMPDGELLDALGKSTTLTRARDGRPAVVVLYRGAWCPYCSITLSTYQTQLLPTLTEQSVPLIAVSPQKPDGSLTMREVNELTYTVVSDPGNQIAKRLGVLTAPTPAVQAVQASLGLDLALLNADGTRGVPMPTTVIVDADGVIRWIDVHPNYATRTEPAQILDALGLILG